MTDDEAVEILITDSFNDSPRRYYEAMNLAVNGFIRYSKIKKIVTDFNATRDSSPMVERAYAESTKIEQVECFEQIQSIIGEED